MIKNKFYVLKVLFVSIALMACSFTANVIPPVATATQTVIPNTSTPQATPTSVITPTPYYKVESGPTIRINSGGFRFSQIKGYTAVSESNLGAYLVSPDKQIEIGLFAYPRPGGAAITGLISDWRDGFSKDFDNIDFTDGVKSKKNGVDAISLEFSGTNNEIPFTGRLIVYAPASAKILYLYTLAYGDQRWQREGQKVFETTTNSLAFFNITALGNCPLSKDSEYGTIKKPIKIGGGDRDGRYRINNYLGTLLGLRGEIISYSINEPIIQKGIKLDVYLLRIGNDYKKMYFDKANFEELHVPYGLTCSAPLLGKPGSGGGSNG